MNIPSPPKTQSILRLPSTSTFPASTTQQAAPSKPAPHPGAARKHSATSPHCAQARLRLHGSHAAFQVPGAHPPAQGIGPVCPRALLPPSSDLSFPGKPSLTLAPGEWSHPPSRWSWPVAQGLTPQRSFPSGACIGADIQTGNRRPAWQTLLAVSCLLPLLQRPRGCSEPHRSPL